MDERFNQYIEFGRGEVYFSCLSLIDRGTPYNHFHSHLRSVYIIQFTYPQMDVLGLWEEAGVSGENPHRHR